MTKQLIAACMVMLAVVAGAGTFETEDLFSITLPSGWVRMPDNVMLTYAENVAQQSPDAPAEVYDYGFQLESAQEWFSYPCILVQVQNIGRFSTGDLERFAQNAEGEVSSMNNDTLFMDVHEMDGVKVLVARQLTEYGFIELSGFATADTFEEYEAAFRDAFSSLQIDELLQYKPQITDNAPVVGSINLGKVVLVFVQAALIGGGLWLVYGLLKRLIRRPSVKNA